MRACRCTIAEVNVRAGALRSQLDSLSPKAHLTSSCQVSSSVKISILCCLPGYITQPLDQSFCLIWPYSLQTHQIMGNPLTSREGSKKISLPTKLLPSDLSCSAFSTSSAVGTLFGLTSVALGASLSEHPVNEMPDVGLCLQHNKELDRLNDSP